jgi:hypothetical protein
MRHRPKPIFIRKMYIEKPPDHMRRKLIGRYKRGGLPDFEEGDRTALGGISLEQIAFTDPVTKELLKWVYVGSNFWCRVRKFGKKKDRVKYEFGRFCALNIHNNKIVAYWNQGKHDFSEEPVRVFRRKDGAWGIISGYNDYEVYIRWGKDIAVPCRDIGEISFEFFEDEKKFSKIFSNIKK